MIWNFARCVYSVTFGIFARMWLTNNAA